MSAHVVGNAMTPSRVEANHGSDHPGHGAADQRFMRLALRAARCGHPSPNPHVGAVIVCEGRVVGIGHHHCAGGDHAEVAAIRDAGAAARGATLYVTLEPCHHHGRTPPCTEAIVAAGIQRVVFGCRDPLPHRLGSVSFLRDHGIDVLEGVAWEACQRLIASFTKHRSSGMPFVTLKAALTLDGKLATRSGDSKWITGPLARRHAHMLRRRSDAVLVGVDTVLADNPRLNLRDLRGQTPRRVVLDASLRMPPHAALLHLPTASSFVDDADLTSFGQGRIRGGDTGLAVPSGSRKGTCASTRRDEVAPPPSSSPPSPCVQPSPSVPLRAPALGHQGLEGNGAALSSRARKHSDVLVYHGSQLSQAKRQAFVDAVVARQAEQAALQVEQGTGDEGAAFCGAPTQVELVPVPEQSRGLLSLPAVLADLGRRDVVDLLVEGGAKVHGAFLRHDLVDALALFYAPLVTGDGHALDFASGAAHEWIRDVPRFVRTGFRRLGPDWLVELHRARAASTAEADPREG